MCTRADSQNHAGTLAGHRYVNQSYIHTAQREPHVCMHWHTHALSNSMGSKAPTGHQALKGLADVAKLSPKARLVHQEG